MLAFSGNALLTRAALASYNMDPELVLLLRVSAGAITLLLICYLRKYSLKIFSNLHLKTAAALSLYLVGFSYAFTGLETGIGVLIQFGVVQLIMFASSFRNFRFGRTRCQTNTNEKIPPQIAVNHMDAPPALPAA